MDPKEIFPVAHWLTIFTTSFSTAIQFMDSTVELNIVPRGVMLRGIFIFVADLLMGWNSGTLFGSYTVS